MAEPLAGYLISYWDNSPSFSSQCKLPLGCRLFIAGRDNIFFFPEMDQFSFAPRYFLLLLTPFPLYSSKQLDLYCIWEKNTIAGKQTQQTTIMIKLLHLISVHFLKQITQGIKKVWEKWSHAYMHTTLTSVSSLYSPGGGACASSS